MMKSLIYTMQFIFKKIFFFYFFIEKNRNVLDGKIYLSF